MRPILPLLLVVVICATKTLADEPKARETKTLKQTDALVVLTDNSWKAYNKVRQGWHERDFDDSEWDCTNVVPGPDERGAQSSIANQFGQPSKAEWIWTEKSDQYFMRKTFDVPKVVRQAEMLYTVSGIAVVYLNGTRLSRLSSTHEGWGSRGAAYLHDLSGYLIPGQTNVLAVCLENKFDDRLDKGNQAGFATELRINSPSFVPDYLRKAVPEPKAEVVTRIKSLVKTCDDPRFSTRETATSDLIEIARQEGQSVYKILDELRALASPEQEWRINLAWVVLKRDRYEASSSKGIDPKFCYPQAGKEQIKLVLFGDGDKRTLTLRHLVQLRNEHNEHGKKFATTLRKTWSYCQDDQKAELIQAIAFLNWVDYIELIDAAKVELPSSDLSAAVAVAYGRMDSVELTKDRLAWLKAAKESKHESTARAATAALLARGVR